MAGHDSAAAVNPSVFAALAASFQLLRRRPLLSCALGAAVGFSLLSTCCGLGFVTTPFFICELFALQLTAYTARPIERLPAYVRAGSLLFAGMLMVGAVLVISLLGSASESSPTALSPSGVAAALLGSAVAWILMTPLMYAPLMLLEHPVRAELALAKSANMVLRAGLFANVRLAFSVFCLQHAPFALCAWLVSIDDARAALWFLCFAPLVCVSVPLGQGMLVSRYVQRGERALAATTLPEPLRRWVRVWALLIVLPILSLVLLELLLSRPSHIAPGETPAGEVLHELTPDERVQSIELPASALSLQISASRVSVAASDGGGVGELPLAAAEPIQHVRVVRVRDTFAVELTQAGRTYLTRIDRAGVRLDDDLPARLRDRSQPWQWLYLLWTLVFTVLLSVPVLADLAAAGEQTAPPTAAGEFHRKPGSREGFLGLGRGDVAAEQALRRARLLAVLLLPWGVGSLGMALYALFTA